MDTLLEVVGAVALTVGAGLAWLPLGVIVGGICMIVAGYLLES